MNKTLTVSLIGRPNVGKSSIFNRLMRQGQRALTYDQPGVTRDRHYGILNVENPTGDEAKDMILVDTGGFYPEKIEVDTKDYKNSPEPFFNLMASHAKLAIDESDLILFVVDVREGLLPFDKTIGDYLRKSKKPVWILVNKYDTDKQMGDEAEFYGIHHDDFILCSAEHARGINQVRDDLYSFICEFEDRGERTIQSGVLPNYDVASHVAIIGAPNAGKSTLLNALLGAQRALVSDIAGTTVDPIEGYFDLFLGKHAETIEAFDNEFIANDAQLLKEIYDADDNSVEDNSQYFIKDEPGEVENDEFLRAQLESLNIEGVSENEADEELSAQADQEEPQEETEKYNPFRSVKIVDTAGIRRNKSITGEIESRSVYRSLRAITESEVVILLIDASKGISHHDRRLCDIALQKGKSIILCLNKMDLFKDVMMDQQKKKEWLLDLRGKISWLHFCEIITISAKYNKHIKSLKKALTRTIMVRHKKVRTAHLNDIVNELVDNRPVVVDKLKGARLKLKYAAQIKSDPPTFLMFTNKSKGIPMNYRRYLVNNIRSAFELYNTPVHLIFRTSTELEGRVKKTLREKLK